MPDSDVPQIRVDRTKCIGTGNCAFYAPNTFEIDAENTAFVIDPEGDPIEAVQRAISQCPTTALSLAEEAGAA